MAKRTFRVPITAGPQDTAEGRTLEPGQELSDGDLALASKDDAAKAHDQRLVDEVLIETTAPAKKAAANTSGGSTE